MLQEDDDFMKSFRLMRCITLLLVLALVFSAPCASSAEEKDAQPRLEERSFELMGHSLRWPQVTGLDDAALEENVNRQIAEALGMKELTDRVAQLLSSERKLTVAGWAGAIYGDILCCELTVTGPIRDTRTAESRRACVIDLRDGHAIALDEFFTDAAGARGALEAYLEETVLPELSPHLQAAELLPIPQAYTVSPETLTLIYPTEQMETLAGHPGTVALPWYEWAAYLPREAGSLAERLGVWNAIEGDGQTAEHIRACAETGGLPGLPASLGDRLTDTAAADGLSADPDLFEGGRYVQPDDGVWRDAWLITAFNPDKGDRVTELEGYTVTGIRADRIALWGIRTGETTVEAWRALLGEPDRTVALNADQADALRLPEGTSDYYIFDHARLRLHADAEGVLRSVILTQ